MSKAALRVAYDGEALKGHTMNVRYLGPALMALGEIFVESNKVLNGDRTGVEVHVTPKVEENCFDIGLEVLQQWGKVKELLGTSDIAAAKELIDWLVYGVAGSSGLFYVYRLFRGKRPDNVVHFRDESGNPLVRLQFDGKHDEILDERLYRLYDNDKIRLNLGRLFKPLIAHSGINRFSAYQKGRKDEGVSISDEEAKEMDFSTSGPKEIEGIEEEHEPFEAMLKVYSPVYDNNAPRWRFWYGSQHYYMDVSESNIREVVLKNGGALVDDWFRVLLQVISEESKGGKRQRSYKVLDVLEFIPAYRQTDIFGDDEKTDAIERDSDS